MATHSSVLAWRIPGTGDPGGLPSMGLHRVGHDWSDLAAAAAAGVGCLWREAWTEHVQLVATPWTTVPQAPPSFTIFQSLLSNHLILYHHLLFLPSIFSSIRVFSNESALHIRWPIYWSFSFSQGWFPLGLSGLISLLDRGLSRVFSSTTNWKHQFFSNQLFLWSNSHIHTWLPEKP